MADKENIVDETIEETVENPEEPKGNEDDTKKTPEEVKFEDLPEEVRKFIDRERTKASKTAREKARREALEDPELKKSIREQLEKEANMSAEEKIQEMANSIAKRENRLDAKERLQDAGLKGDELTDILELVVSEDRESTMAKTDRFVRLFKSSLDSALEAKTKELVKGTPKPKSNSAPAKSFKDMSFDERAQLKKSDPARYEAEMKKSRTRI